jgi:hypothetical protein
MDELERRLDAQPRKDEEFQWDPAFLASMNAAVEARRAEMASGGGQPCGQSHIAPGLTCHKGAGAAAAAEPKSAIEKKLGDSVYRRWENLKPNGEYTASAVLTSDKGAYRVRAEDVTRGSESLKEGVHTLGVEVGDAPVYKLSFSTSVGDGSGFDYDRRERLEPEVGRQLAKAISIELKELFSGMQENALVVCHPWDEDGLEGKRRKLYERAGFIDVTEFYPDHKEGTMVGLVRGGKLVKARSLLPQAARRDASDVIDLEALIAQLLAVGAGQGARIDALLERLDASRKAAPSPGQGDLFSAPSGGGGQPCGASHIAPDLTCHKGTAVGKSEAPAAAGTASKALPPLGKADYGRMIAAAEIPTREEDWGARQRGQGKRIGGMVQGAMSAGPVGIKTYADPKNARGVTEEIREELSLLAFEDKKAVIGALQAGYSAQDAFLLAYNHGIAAGTAYRLANPEPPPPPGLTMASGAERALEMRALRESGQELRKGTPQVKTLEQHQAAAGSTMEVTAAAISPGGRTRMSQKQVGRMNATVEQQKAKIREARELLEADYNQKVAAGELRPPTRLERMKATAAGHPDNPSVQAARRIVAKLEAKTVPAPPAQRGNVVPGVNAGPGFLGDIAVPRRKVPAAPKEDPRRKQLIADLAGYGEKLKPSEADEITTGDLESMVMAQEIKAGRRRPKAELSAREVETPKQQAVFARQQQKQAAAAGDQKGAKAWEKENRTIERNRVAAAMARQQASQTGLFGVTEYDNTMPLFARRDAADPVGRMLQDVLSEQLPGSQVLDWEQHSHGVTSGRVAAEGLLYRFRCDGEGVGYRPAWDGLSERAWEARSQGFLELRVGAGTRMDFKRPKFTQLASKRKCSTGYSCGSSCISLQKECRVTPRSAMSKQRLRQLSALAKEGDPMAKQQASAVETARLQKAFELREKRDVDKLKKMRERPEIAEFLRTGKLPAAPAGADAPGQRSSKVRDISPDEIDVDPKRFQYKMKATATGEVGSLKGVKKWDENLAGVISVWEDPADGKTYVVNGHNRIGLARRLGAENVTVRFLDAPDAKTARAIGAMQNIAEGAGTEIDAAKFFRDTGIKNQQQIEEKGLPLNSGKAEKGLALAKLPAEMFNAVVQGDLSIGRGAIIGGSGLPMEKQREIGKMLRSRKSVSDGTLNEYVQSLAVSETINQGTLDVFGNKETVDTGLTRAELANGLRRKLAKERSLFATVSKSRAAEALQEKAGNVINQAESATVASEAAQVLRVFNQMKNQSGPISAALNSAAARVQSGEPLTAVRRELEELVIAGMQEELERAGLRQRPSNEAPTASLFDSITLEDRLAVLQGRMDAPRRKSSGKPRAKAKCNTGTPCGTVCLPPSKTCRSKSAGAAAVGEQLNAVAAAPAKAPAASAPPQAPPARPAAGAAAAAAAAAAPKPPAESPPPAQGRRGRLQSAAAGFVEKAKAPDQPQKGIFGKYRETAEDGTGETGGKVGLDAPVKLKDWTGKMVETDSVAFEIQIEKEAVGPKLIAQLKEMGLSDLPDSGVKALAMGFTTGANRGSLGYNQMAVPPEVGQRVSSAVFREMQDVIKGLPDGQLVTCEAWSEDGLGSRRQRLYERAGFSAPLYEMGPMFAVVQGGKLQRIGGAREDGRFDGDGTIDLEGLLYELVMLSPDGEGDGDADRADGLEDRLARLDSRLMARITREVAHAIC